MIELLNTLSSEGNFRMGEAIKILLYKQNDNIFEYLDFENDTIYKDPFLYTYFSSDKLIPLDYVLFSYYNIQSIKTRTDQFGRLYIPNVGWFITEYINQEVTVRKPQFEVYFDKKKIDYTFEKIDYIENTRIEIIKYPLTLLEDLYTDPDANVIAVEITEITKKQKKSLIKAYNLINQYNPYLFKLFEKFAFKCVVFNGNFLNKNSFAHKHAHGVTFYNSYQEDYDEIFFMDDISHQSAHVILTTILFENDRFFIIDKNISLQEFLVGKENNIIESRTMEVVFHALFTYYFIFDNLDKILSSASLTQKQKHECLGRIAIYILKCQNDFLLIADVFGESRNIFSEDGLVIFKKIEKKHSEMKIKYGKITSSFDFTAHPYNFTYKEFINRNQYENYS